MAKKLQNPITIIRKPEEINKEYSEIVTRLGAQELDLANLSAAQARIKAEREKMISRVNELRIEMDEAQKELKRKEEEEKKMAPELPLEKL